MPWVVPLAMRFFGKKNYRKISNRYRVKTDLIGMMIFNQKLNEAIQFHQQGQLSQAEPLYRALLNMQPNNLHVLQALSVLLAQNKDFQAALQLMSKSIEIDANNADLFYNRGKMFQDLGQPNDALNDYQRTLALRPNYPDCHNNLGIILLALGRIEEALLCFKNTLALTPTHLNALLNLANTLQEQVQHQEALVYYQKLLAIQTDFALAYFRQGNSFIALNRLQEALESYSKSIHYLVDPDPHSTSISDGLIVEAYNNRGNVLKQLGDCDGAIKNYDIAIKLRPNFADAFNNRAATKQHLQRFEDAIQDYQQAILYNDNYFNAYNNLGLLLADIKRFDESITLFKKALIRFPTSPILHFNLGLSLLAIGDYEQGFKEYQWRWQFDVFVNDNKAYHAPLWLGDFDIAGKTILIHSEQGLGDTIQFCRFIPEVARMGAVVIVEVEDSLVALMQSIPAIKQVIEKGQMLPDYDAHCPMLSLALACKTTLKNIPVQPKYLSVDETKLSTIKKHLSPHTKPRVGLVWRGNNLHNKNKFRSVQFNQIVSHLPPNCTYISLQKEIELNEQTALDDYPNKVFFTQHLTTMADTAALIEACDVIVSVDTAVAHLAAALGKPTWILLPYNADWRWLATGNTSPWYPSVTLLRQSKFGEWDDVMHQLADKLRELVS